MSNHYKGLRPYWRYSVRYNTVGRRGQIPSVLWLAYDLPKFVLAVLFGRYDLVVLNPSLGRRAIRRDAVFLWLAKKLGQRVVVFFHGWDPSCAQVIDSAPCVFARRFGEADAFIVLAEQFREKLVSWGIDAPVVLSTTKVDDRLIGGLNLEKKRYAKTLLFLARVEENKGIFIALEAFRHVLDVHPQAKFLVAGSGAALAAASAFVEENSIENVEFLGELSGAKLIDAFRTADAYILPTFHEGMPTAVLEAMAFGLPVITRPVGGLTGFFEDQKMGYLSDTLDPLWFGAAVSRLFSAPGRMKEIGLYNHHYAKGRFLASKVASRLEAILRSV